MISIWLENSFSVAGKAVQLQIQDGVVIWELDLHLEDQDWNLHSAMKLPEWPENVHFFWLVESWVLSEENSGKHSWL